jgi:hypothetical protein
LNSTLLEPALNRISHGVALGVKTDKGSVSTDITNELMTVSLDVAKFNFKEGRNILYLLEVITVLDFFPSSSKVKQLHHVDVLVKACALGMESEFSRAVETAHSSFASEGNDVGGTAICLVKVPVIVSPHLTSLSKASSSLINDERNSLSSADSSNSLVENWSSTLVLKRSNGLNNHRANVFTGITLLSNLSLKRCNTTVLFSLV